MARRGFKHRLKVTRESIEKFCHDLKIVKMLTSPDRPSSSGAESVSLLSEEDDVPCYKPRPFMERLNLSGVGPSEGFQNVDENNTDSFPDLDGTEAEKPVNSTPRKTPFGFDLPRSPRTEAISADRNVELRKLRRKSIESPRSFLNGLTGVDSLPAVIAASKKENGSAKNTSQILLVSFIFISFFSLICVLLPN